MKLKIQARTLRPKAAGGPDGELLIYGDIGETWWGTYVDANSVNEQLTGLSATHLLVRINSGGGSVTDGIAILNIIRGLGIRVTVRIEGIAASIASVIAMAGDTVQAYANTTFMTHLPWSLVAGNAVELREFADVLDTFGESIAQSYARKTGRTADEELARISDGKDHWYSATQARDEGYVDEVLDELELADDDASAQFAPAIEAMTRYRTAPQAIAASVHPHVARALRTAAAGTAPTAPAQPTPAASAAHPEECNMKWTAIAQALGLTVKADATETQVREQVCQHLKLDASVGDDAVMAAVLKAQAGVAPAHPAPAAPQPAEPTRAEQINQIFAFAAEARPDDAQLTQLRAAAHIGNEDLATVRTQLLAYMEQHPVSASSVGGRYVAAEAGEDERDKRINAAGDYLVHRSGVTSHGGEEAKRIRQAMNGNPFRGHSYSDIARAVLEDNGINCRGMGRIEVVEAAIRAAATHTTDDFPNIFENALHKTLVLGGQAVNPTWRQFCRTGSIADFREHPRYRAGSFSSLEAVNEAGEYPHGTIADAERESITGRSKGKRLSITRDMLINDDMGVFSNIAFLLGQAAERSIEIDVYALFALNSGNGPTLGDGKAMFHADHNNIAAVAAAPSVEAIEAARVLMGNQQDVGGNDFLDIRPDLWLGPLSLGGTARVVNNSEYDPDATNKLQRVNKVRGLFSDVVDTPRLTGTPWYMLANPAIEPVFEVAFLDGIEETQLAMEEKFSTAGMEWRVIRDYAVGGVGYRGIVKNAGASS